MDSRFDALQPEKATQPKPRHREPVLPNGAAFKYRLLTKIAYYEKFKLPQDNSWAKFFEEKVSYKATGRKRAADYKAFVEQFEGEEKDLLLAVSQDVFPTYQNPETRLGSSSTLRELLENALYEALNISPEDRVAAVAAAQQVQIFSHSAWTGGVAEVQADTVKAKGELVREAIRNRYPELRYRDQHNVELKPISRQNA